MTFIRVAKIQIQNKSQLILLEENLYLVHSNSSFIVF